MLHTNSVPYITESVAYMGCLPLSVRGLLEGGRYHFGNLYHHDERSLRVFVKTSCDQSLLPLGKRDYGLLQQ